MTVLSNIITPSNVLTTTNTATVTNKTLTSPTVAGMTVSDGTANGVTFLNGSKVLTSGSALTFDGTNFGVGATTVAARVDIVGGSNNQFRLSSSETDATTKEGKFLLRHYTNAQPNFLVMYPFSTSTDNAIFYGGGSSSQTAATYHAWSTAANNTTVSGSEQMRLTSTGLGIGTTSPAVKVHAYSGTTMGQMTVDGAGAIKTGINFASGGTTYGQIYFDNNSPYDMSVFQQYSTGSLRFGTNNTERARIDSSGNLLVGTTSVAASNSRLSLAGAVNWGVGPASGGSTFYIYNASNVGVYLTDGANTWASSSDERKKDIIEPITDAANKITQLRAVIGKYKTDAEGTRRSFLIAQDLQSVLPEAVDSSEADSLGVRYTDVIPLLVAAIKEQTTLIKSLKARLDAANL